jgi:hypothetical protein
VPCHHIEWRVAQSPCKEPASVFGQNRKVTLAILVPSYGGKEVSREREAVNPDRTVIGQGEVPVVNLEDVSYRSNRSVSESDRQTYRRAEGSLGSASGWARVLQCHLQHDASLDHADLGRRHLENTELGGHDQRILLQAQRKRRSAHCRERLDGACGTMRKSPSALQNPLSTMSALQLYIWTWMPDCAVGSPWYVIVFRPCAQSTLVPAAGKSRGIHRSWFGVVMPSGERPSCLSPDEPSGASSNGKCVTAGRIR